MSNPLKSVASKAEFSSSSPSPAAHHRGLNISSQYFVENLESMASCLSLTAAQISIPGDQALLTSWIPPITATVEPLYFYLKYNFWNHLFSPLITLCFLTPEFFFQCPSVPQTFLLHLQNHFIINKISKTLFNATQNVVFSPVIL